MRFHVSRRLKAARYLLGAAVAVGSFAGLAHQGTPSGNVGPISAALAADAPEPKLPPNTVEVNEGQLRGINVAPVSTHLFQLHDSAIGSIDFNEDMQAQVFTPYQGRIVSLFAKVGDDVEKGKPLFTIDSPDLIAAESNLISAAGVLKLTSKALDRAKGLLAIKGVAEKDYDQAVSDQQAADGAYKAALDAVRIFGKTEAEITKIVANHKIDSILVVNSPVNGRVTARSAAPGLFVQPGNAPAPFTMSDISTMWLLANVPEATIAHYKVGQSVDVSVSAYPGKVFEGKLSVISPVVDPTTRRVTLRSEIADPDHLLRSGMFANFVISLGEGQTSLAVPVGGTVREGDGAMTVWVTTDKKRFTKRVVTLGISQDGFNQVLDGLKPGELIATEGALFLDNALNGVDTD